MTRIFLGRGAAGASLYRGLVASVLVVCAMLLGFDGWRTWQARSVQIAASTAQTENLARSLAQHAHDTIQAADTVVVSLRQMVEADGLGPDRIGHLQRLMALDIATLPAIHGLLVYDAAGHWVVNSTPGAAMATTDTDRDYFQYHRDNPGRGVHVGGPYRSRTDGRWIVAVSRRLDAPDGSFAGLVLATLSVEALRDFYATFDVGRQGVIALATVDGTIIVRHPADRDYVGTSIAGGQMFRRYRQRPNAGSLQYVAASDGFTRLGSYRQVEGFPLLIVVSHGLDEALSGWRRDAWLHLALSLGVSSLVAWLGSRFARQIRDRQQAEQRYRLLADHSSDAILCVAMDGRPLYASPALATLTGRAGDEAGQDWTRFVHPEDRDPVSDIGRRLAAGEGQAMATYRYVRGDGSHLWVEARCVPVPAVNGQDRQFIASIRDISERKVVEESLDAAHRELAAQASTDSLTGLANRRRLDEAMAQEWRRATRDAAPISLLMIDVDCFKAYNDRYGHPQGDQCLRAVAAAIDCSVRRPGDLVARYGGEEFVVVLADTEAPGAADVAERIRAAIQALGMEHAGNLPPACVTASIGVATAWPAPNGMDPVGETLVAAADAALYGAKRGGRNRIEVARPAPALPAEERPSSELAA